MNSYFKVICVTALEMTDLFFSNNLLKTKHQSLFQISVFYSLFQKPSLKRANLIIQIFYILSFIFINENLNIIKIILDFPEWNLADDIWGLICFSTILDSTSVTIRVKWNSESYQHLLNFLWAFGHVVYWESIIMGRRQRKSSEPQIVSMW